MYEIIVQGERKISQYNHLYLVKKPPCLGQSNKLIVVDDISLIITVLN